MMGTMTLILTRVLMRYRKIQEIPQA